MKLPGGLQKINSMTKAEMVELLLHEEYGYLPKAPLSVRYEVVEEDKRFCAGKAILQKWRVICETEQGSFAFPVAYTMPTKLPKPMPCFIHINFRDLIPDRYQPSEELVDAGVAILSFCYNDVTSDNGDFANGLAGVVTDRAFCGNDRAFCGTDRAFCGNDRAFYGTDRAFYRADGAFYGTYRTNGSFYSIYGTLYKFDRAYCLIQQAINQVYGGSDGVYPADPPIFTRKDDVR